MKLEKLNLKKAEIKKSEMAKIKGGTSITSFIQTGVWELEQEVDSKGTTIGKPILVNFPNL